MCLTGQTINFNCQRDKEINLNSLILMQKTILVIITLLIFSTSYSQTRVKKDSLSPFDIEEPISPKIGLALSGGGARGVAQIGVLKALEEHQIPINLIVGTSMGSIVGGLYSTGYTATELEKLATTLDWNSLLNLNGGFDRENIFLDQKNLEDKTLITLELEKWRPKIPNAVSNGQRLTTAINSLVFQGLYYPDSTFNDLKIPFRSIAVNLADGRRIIFNKGSLVQAMRASMSIPLLFAPYEMDEMRLVDGGVLSNIPVDVAKQEGCDIVVAVNSTGKLQPLSEVNAPWQTADQVLSIMMRLANQIQLRQADITIDVTVEDLNGFDFSNLDTLIENGYLQTQKQLSYLDTLIDYYSRRHGKEINQIIYEGKNKEIITQISTLKLPENSNVLIRKLNKTGLIQKYEIASNDTATFLIVKEFPVVRSISFHGVNLVSENYFRSNFYDLLGKPYPYNSGLSKFRNIIKQYKEKGFLFAEIDSFNFNEQTGNLHVFVDEGVIKSVAINGNEKSKNITITREIPTTENQVFSNDRLDIAMENLVTTNLFNQVSIDKKKTKNGNELLVEVNEKSPLFLRAGFNATETYHAQFFVDLRNENLFGNGAKLGISAFGGDRNLTTKIEYRADRILQSFFTFQSSIYYESLNITYNKYTLSKNLTTGATQQEERTEIGEINKQNIAASFAIGRQYAKFGEISIGLTRKQVRMTQLRGFSGADAGFFTAEKNNLTNLKLESIFDTRDHLIIPQTGSFIQFFYENSTEALGSEITYNKLYIGLETTLPFLPLVTITPKFEFGSSDLAMPNSEAFYLGGARSFYGFRTNDLRGKQVLASHLELNWHTPTIFIFEVILNARYDLGNVWDEQKTIKISDMVHGLGGGITLDTPLGPLSFSTGRYFEISADPAKPQIGWGPMTFYISLGNPFM